jgi:hypothetical protein
MTDPIDEASSGAERSPVHTIWLGLLRFAVPVALLFILWNALPETWHKLRAVAGLG